MMNKINKISDYIKMEAGSSKKIKDGWVKKIFKVLVPIILFILMVTLSIIVYLMVNSPTGSSQKQDRLIPAKNLSITRTSSKKCIDEQCNRCHSWDPGPILSIVPLVDDTDFNCSWCHAVGLLDNASKDHFDGTCTACHVARWGNLGVCYNKNGISGRI